MKGQWPIPNKRKREGDEIRYRAKRKHLWNILRPPETFDNVSEKDRSSNSDQAHVHNTIQNKNKLIKTNHYCRGTPQTKNCRITINSI